MKEIERKGERRKTEKEEEKMTVDVFVVECHCRT